MSRIIKDDGDENKWLEMTGMTRDGQGWLGVTRDERDDWDD